MYAEDTSLTMRASCLMSDHVPNVSPMSGRSEVKSETPKSHTLVQVSPSFFSSSSSCFLFYFYFYNIYKKCVYNILNINRMTQH